jgi:hypothetical protein
MPAPRKVSTFVNVEFQDFIEVEVVDADSRNVAFALWGHEDDTVTLRLENPVREPGAADARAVMFRRSRDAVRAILQGILDQLDNVKPREEPEPYVEPVREQHVEPPTFDPPEPWLPRHGQ